jgi:hypothetical protein
MEAIKVQRKPFECLYYVGDVFKDESGEYYTKAESDAVIARLEAEVEQTKRCLFQAQEIAKELYSALKRYEGDVDADAPVEHIKMMRKAKQALSGGR